MFQHNLTEVVSGYGTLATVAGLTVKEEGNDAFHKTILTLNGVVITTADGTTPATDAHWGTLALYTLPAGHIVFLGAHVVFPLGLIIAGAGGISDTADLEIGVGTTARTNGTNFALQATEDNIVPGQVGVDLTGGTSDAIESSQLAAALFYDGSTTAAVVNLNVVTLDDADAGVTADTLTVSGTITLLWTLQGVD